MSNPLKEPHRMTPEEIHEKADAAYGGDGYDSHADALFVYLVDVAEGVERALRTAGTPDVLARQMIVKALLADLETREGDRGAGALVGESNHDLLVRLVGGPLHAGRRRAPMPDSFAELAGVAWVYERELAGERGSGGGSAPVSLGEASGMSPRVVMLLGLVENLQLRDGDRQGDL